MIPTIFPLLIVLATVTHSYGEYSKLGGECSESCEGTYKEAAICNMTFPAPSMPFEFNSTCLCEPVEFREQAPGCIDCLYRRNIEDEFRETLRKAIYWCTDTIGLKPCPLSCGGLGEMTALCNEEDLARIAAEAAAKAASKSAEEGLASGITVSTATLTGSSDPTDTITSSASVRPVRKAGKKVKEDFSKRCVCKPENKLLVTKCYNCMINHDIPEAETIILQAQMCDPNYGVREPIYRNTGKPDPQATATKISKDTRTGGSRKPSPQSEAPSGHDGIVNMVWWIGFQIALVIGATVYFGHV